MLKITMWNKFIEGFIHFRNRLAQWTWNYDENRHGYMGFTREFYYNCKFNDLTRGDYWRYDTAPWSKFQKMKQDLERNCPGFTLDLSWKLSPATGKFGISATVVER